VASHLVVLLGWWDRPMTYSLTSPRLCHALPCFSDAKAVTYPEVTIGADLEVSFRLHYGGLI
ncbi:hypothetical protein GW17_00018051, partial [Ensete ventricosum]